MSICFAMDRFHTYVYGRQDITVETDHRPLIAIMKKSLATAPKRLQRMLLRLQKYSFKLVYKPGSQMVISDTLSRSSLLDRSSTEFKGDIAALADAGQQDLLHTVASPATIELIKRAATMDDQYQLLRRQIAMGWPQSPTRLPPGIREFATFADELVELVFKGQRVVVPADARAEILQRIHSSLIGINGCLRRAKEAVFYPEMTADIKKIVNNCAVCSEHDSATVKEQLMPYEAPSRPWEKVGVDICMIRQQDYLITVDYLSGYIEVDRLPSKRIADVIYCLKLQFVRRGLPLTVVSDNSPFKAAEFTQFASKYHFKHVTSSPHYPQSNSRAKTAVKTMKRLYEKPIEDRQEPHLALLAWRNTPAEQSQLSPAQMIFGRRTKTNLPMTNELLGSPHDEIAHNTLCEAKEQTSRLLRPRGTAASSSLCR